MEQENPIRPACVAEQLAILQGYFPQLSEKQTEQFQALYDLYADWNAKINVISRKDIENLYLHHVLHSLGITAMLHFKDGSSVNQVKLYLWIKDCQRNTWKSAPCT